MPNNSEEQRYSRQVILPQFGAAMQERLLQSAVLLVGVGGLGTAAASYLAGMGVGRIGLIDFDRVALSNLNRQLLYKEEDVGRWKAETARDRLLEQNPHLRVDAFTNALTRQNAVSVLADFDVIIDATDNLPAKYVINDACVMLDKPWVSASIHRFQGQLAVFNHAGGPTYRCLFPATTTEAVNCEEAGVLGAVPGILGIYQALETVKIITGIGNVLSGRLKLIDFLNFKEEEIRFTRNEQQVAFARKQSGTGDAPPRGIRSAGAEWYLDVREPFEEPRLAHSTLLQIPLRELEERHKEIPRNKPVWVYCQSGQRSAEAVELLSSKFGFANLKNIAGGIKAIMDKP